MTDNSRLLFAEDCLFAMRRLNEEFPNGYADLIYLDPPFNSKTTYNLPFEDKYKNFRQVKAFKDTWKWSVGIENELYKWENCIDIKRTLARIISASCYIQHNYKTTNDSMPTYLFYMAERLLEMRVALKKTGSIYLHCDPIASHYLKLLMDAIFGKDNFRNEIVWKRTSAHNNAKRCGSIHDIILFYTKSKNFIWNGGKHEYDQEYLDNYYKYEDEDGKKYTQGDLTAPSYNVRGNYEWKGHRSGSGNGCWRYSKEKMDELYEKGLIVYSQNNAPRLKRYLDLDKGTPLQDLWLDINPISTFAKEKMRYPTQKPQGLLERIILASSNEGDTVIDTFCGCGTAIHAAEKLKRKWMGMDISAFSIGLVKYRLVNDKEINKIRKILPLIKTFGLFIDEKDAKKRAEDNPYEFEKVVCGMLMCLDLYENKRPGQKGQDRGVDGVIPIKALTKKNKDALIIVQVKSGKVTVDSVKAMKQTVDTIDRAVMGIFVCLENQMGVVERNRSKKMVTIQMGLFTKEYPMIQGLSVKDLIAGNADKLDLPIQSFIR